MMRTMEGPSGDALVIEILNSAMEAAYAKIRSSEGDIGRLNGRSRFCELAIVQLEWCLKFSLQEMDMSAAENAAERERLMRDLMQTRDKMRERMAEIDLAVAEKDRELRGTAETESSLRWRLELRAEELRRLRASLELGRADGIRTGGKTDRDCSFDDLKMGIQEQIESVGNKLGNMSTVDADQAYASSLVMEMGVIKEKVNLGFDMMGSALSSLKAQLEECQCRTGFEDEIVSIIHSNFLKGINGTLLSLSEGRSVQSREIASLDDELEVLDAQINLHFENAGLESSLANSERNSCSPCEERQLNHPYSFVSEFVQSREFALRKKIGEINWSRREKSINDMCLSLQNEDDLDSFRKIVRNVSFKLEGIIKEKTRAAKDSDGLTRLQKEDMYSEENICEEGNEKRLIQKSESFHGESEIDNHTMERIRPESPNAIIFNEVRDGLHEEFIEFKIETQISDDMCKLIINEWVKQLNHDRLTNETRVLKSENIDQIITSKNSKYINLIDTATTGIEQEGMPFLSDLLQEVDLIQAGRSAKEKDIALDTNLDLVDPCLSSCELDHDFNYFDLNNFQAPQISSEEDNSFYLACSKYEKALRQMASSKEQIKEMGSSFGISFDNGNMMPCQTALVPYASGNDFSVPQTKDGDFNWKELHIMLAPLTNYSHAMKDFNILTCEIIGTSLSRLEGLSDRMNSLLHQVRYLKKAKLLYQKAFRRRCLDLQTAEAEVDLLGDQVDSLFVFLEKIYTTIKQHSPIFKHHSWMLDILKLIEKKLREEPYMFLNDH